MYLSYVSSCCCCCCRRRCYRKYNVRMRWYADWYSSYVEISRIYIKFWLESTSTCNWKIYERVFNAINSSLRDGWICFLWKCLKYETTGFWSERIFWQGGICISVRDVSWDENKRCGEVVDVSQIFVCKNCNIALKIGKNILDMVQTIAN